MLGPKMAPNRNMGTYEDGVGAQDGANGIINEENIGEISRVENNCKRINAKLIHSEVVP